MTPLTPRPKTNWQSWHTLWSAVPLFLLSLFFVREATVAYETASRQQISAATITDCERAGKSGYSCVYLFTVGNTDYRGRDQMEHYLLYGQTEDVYYDSQRPARNSLHDFSEKMRRNLLFAGVLLSGIAVIIARILYAKAEAR